MRKLAMVLLAALLWPLLCPGQQATLPPWTPGTLDIHQISTGRGNSALFVFPDGTTMLFDAGAAGDGETIPDIEPRPDGSRRAGEWIARYVSHMLPPDHQQLDYAVVSHYHADHIGQVTKASPAAPGGGYKLTGITDVDNAIPIKTLIDRGEDYRPPPPADPTYANYRAFVASRSRRGLRHEKIAVGRDDQIVLLRQPKAYPTFSVRAVAANGEVWSGEGSQTKQVFPALQGISQQDQPSENMCSVGIRIEYGKFDYFTGGDMPGIPDAGAPEWQALEPALAQALGVVDVRVINHHGSINAESAAFSRALRSRVVIIPAWSPTHPSQDVLQRILSPRLHTVVPDVFATWLREPTKASIGARAQQLKADHGHIVVRVAPGGDSYRVFVLDDTNDRYEVMKTFGPYESKAIPTVSEPGRDK